MQHNLAILGSRSHGDHVHPIQAEAAQRCQSSYHREFAKYSIRMQDVMTVAAIHEYEMAQIPINSINWGTDTMITRYTYNCTETLPGMDNTKGLFTSFPLVMFTHTISSLVPVPRTAHIHVYGSIGPSK